VEFKNGEFIYKSNIDGKISIEKDFFYLVEPTKQEKIEIKKLFPDIKNI